VVKCTGAIQAEIVTSKTNTLR